MIDGLRGGEGLSPSAAREIKIERKKKEAVRQILTQKIMGTLKKLFLDPEYSGI
jgi:hypothetical protein